MCQPIFLNALLARSAFVQLAHPPAFEACKVSTLICASLCICRSSQKSPNSTMNVLMVLKYHPFSQRGIVWGGKTVKDRPRFRWVRGGHWCPRHIPRWLRRLIPGTHMYHEYTWSTPLYVHGWAGGTVGDYIQRSLERGVSSPGTVI